MTRERLPMYVVYDHPLDAPETYVVRQWNLWLEAHSGTLAPGKVVFENEDLDACYLWLQLQGKRNIGVDNADDPVIESVWV